MKNFTPQLFRNSILLIYIFVFFCLFSSLLSKDEGISMLNSVEPITIHGVVSIDGKPARQINEALWEDGIQHKLVAVGKFSHPVLNGESLILWPRNLRVKVYVNGILKISTGQRDEFPDFIQYAGNSYKIFYIGEISTDDIIRMEIEKAYDSCRINVVTTFFDHIYCAREEAVYQSIITNEMLHPFVGLLLTLTGILVLLASLLQQFTKYRLKKEIYYLGWFCTVSGIFYICDSAYEYIDLLIPFPVLNTLVDLCCFPLLLFFYLMFITNMIKSRIARRFMKWITAFFAISELIPFFLQITGVLDLHITQDLYVMIGGILIFFAFVCLLYEILIQKRKDLWQVFFAALPLLISLSLKIITVLAEGGVERRYLRFGILASCIFLIHHTFKYVKRSMELLEQEQQMKQEINRAKISIMLSQIQPHFLYNSLNILQHICEKDGKLAAEAIDHFSRYLRGNMDSLTTDHPIPFNQELDHVKHYLYMEQLRFGDRVKIEYNLETTDFYIPTLTLQPIVENAIRHGITKQADGGIIRITTKVVKDEIWIIVSDNGIGFEAGFNADQSKSHIGINNVRKRVELQCDGTVTISSLKGIGTQVIIRMKGMKPSKYESNSC